MNVKKISYVASAAMMALLTGCGGGSGAGTGPSVQAAGVYEGGYMTGSSSEVNGLAVAISNAGRVIGYAPDDNAIFVGTATQSGANLIASLMTYQITSTTDYRAEAVGSPAPTSLSGTVLSDKSIQGGFITNSVTSSYGLNFSTENTSVNKTVQTLAANFQGSDVAADVVTNINIDSNGNLTGSDVGGDACSYEAKISQPTAGVAVFHLENAVVTCGTNVQRGSGVLYYDANAASIQITISNSGYALYLTAMELSQK